jgi:hypothetical protein
MAKQIWSDSHGKQHKTKKDAEFMDSMYSAADGLEVARKKKSTSCLPGRQ